MDTGKDYYAILGVLPEAEPEIIRAVYLTLAKKYHPDSSGGAGNEDRLKEINAAYEILNNPARRSEYDAIRAEGNFDTGDYEPNVDDENLSSDDIKDDWEFAVEYHPELISLLKEVASISPTLSIVFQSTILSKKAFNEARNIKDQLISNFLQRFFGKSNRTQKFAKLLLLKKHMAAAKDLNRAIKIFGEEVDHEEIITKIQIKFKLDNSIWDTVETPDAELEHWGIIRIGNNFLLGNAIYQKKREAIVMAEVNLDKFFNKAPASKFQSVLNSCGYSATQTSADHVQIIAKDGTSMILATDELPQFIRSNISPNMIRQCKDYINFGS